MSLNALLIRQRSRWRMSFWLLSLSLVVVCFYSLSVGELWIKPWAPDGALEQQLLIQLRLPRLLAAFAVGAALASSGAVLQVLLGNPLAEPGVLGISGGAVYATANSVLDGFVGHRQTMGLRVMSIQWGAWMEIGMFARGAASSGPQIWAGVQRPHLSLSLTG